MIICHGRPPPSNTPIRLRQKTRKLPRTLLMMLLRLFHCTKHAFHRQKSNVFIILFRYSVVSRRIVTYTFWYNLFTHWHLRINTMFFTFNSPTTTTTREKNGCLDLLPNLDAGQCKHKHKTIDILEQTDNSPIDGNNNSIRVMAAEENVL